MGDYAERRQIDSGTLSPQVGRRVRVPLLRHYLRGGLLLVDLSTADVAMQGVEQRRGRAIDDRWK